MESKTLTTIQTLMKVGRILSGIAYVCSLVGGILCIVGLVTAGAPRSIVLGGVTIHTLIASLDNLNLGAFYSTAVTALFACISTCILAKLASRYFNHELTAGTPFTIEGARELLRLGICIICVPLAAIIIAKICCATIGVLFPGEAIIDFNAEAPVLLGVVIIVMSLFCKYGAESNRSTLA